MTSKQMKNEDNNNEKKNNMKNQSVINVLKLHNYIK